MDNNVSSSDEDEMETDNSQSDYDSSSEDSVNESDSNDPEVFIGKNKKKAKLSEGDKVLQMVEKLVEDKMKAE